VRRIYCISGLGADHRVFSKLKIPGFELVAVPWLFPLAAEPLPSYAARMYGTIPEKDPIVMGLSFGGMLTTEIKKQFAISHAIIVSSAKTRAEIGYNNDAFAWLAGKKFLPDQFFIRPAAAILFLLGAQTEDEKQLLASMIKSGNPKLNRWMVNALLNWDNERSPEGIIHIHGTADRVIRPGNVHPTNWVSGGGHFMVYNRAAEISRIISDSLPHQF